MVRNIVIVLILLLICVPSWQIGTIMIQKKQVTYMLEEQANSIKRYQQEDIVKKNLASELATLNLPTNFTFEMLEIRKVRIRYIYKAAASIFGYTYYEVNAPLEAITEDGKFER